MPKMTLNRKEYRDKVLACWMGKNIGGTLGAPMEWKRQLNDVSFYTQELCGEPLPNDDLDIQLLWVVAMEERGVDVDAHTLAEYWRLFVAPHWAEYGAGKVNMNSGLLPPLTGSRKNVFKDSCGAFIRSEIWACIAPGCPDLAVKFAFEDAILDHGDGEGTYAEIFCAALESAAFVVSDVRALIDIGLSYIPKSCACAAAVHTAIESYDKKMGWVDARDLMLERHRGSAFYESLHHISERDLAKGFFTGKLGYDVPSNIGIVVLGLLYGEGDFAKTICTAVNCGEDTDCTGATVGSIFGIMHGMKAIPEEWITPIGHSIKTVCLNLGDLGSGTQLPQTVDELTDRTERLAQHVLGRGRSSRVVISDGTKTDLSDVKPESLKATDGGESLYHNARGPVFRFDFFEIMLDYGDDPSIRAGIEKTLRVEIRNRYKTQANLTVRWYLPDGWTILPGQVGSMFMTPYGQLKNQTVEYRLLAPTVNQSMNRAVIEITIEGRPTAMLVPVTLLNGTISC